MELSIIVTNYKNPELLKVCIDSIKKNINLTDYEIIVADSATDEDTELMMEDRFPEIAFIPSVDNIGFGGTVNNGLKVAKGKYVLILNGDIIVKKDAIGILLRYIKEHQDVGIVAPQLLNFNETYQPSTFRFYTPLTILYRRTFLGKMCFAKKHLDSFLMKDFDHQEVRKVDWIMGSSLMAQKKAIDKVGPMDMRFKLYFEDTDWCRRFWENGYSVVYFPNAQMYHYHGRGSAGKSIIRTLLFNRLAWIHIFSAIKYFQKYAGRELPNINNKKIMEETSLQTDSGQLSQQKNSEEKNKELFRRYLLIFAFLFLIAGSFWYGYGKGKTDAEAGTAFYPINSTAVSNKLPQDKSTLDFSLFWKVWDLLGKKYVNHTTLNAQDLVYGAIKGMLKATGDPYTNFFTPKETKDFSQDIGGSFEGIGAELGIKDGILTVIAPLDGSPSQKAGLLAGDKIVKINDKSTADITIEQAVDLIRGSKGTSVKLTVLQGGNQETTDISVTRDVIEVKSVKVEFKDDSIAYLKINQFGEKTSKEFDLAMNQIIGHNSRGIVLDLRNNPGGFLDSSVEIASRLIPRGKVVVIEENGEGKKDNLYTTGGDKLSGIPMVALINEGSASAAEILAGALRDDRQIQLIGKKSFGKGSVQEFIDLPGKASVKITVAKWMTPNGDYIMEKGINPDADVDLSLEDFKNGKDPQLDKAIEVIKGLVK